ncbi:MAG: hypothetical protein JNL70_21240 [Saprospiraceae bacterium]|nr:hypothetical protein [Saprospiraceae bacterium]
MKKLMVLIASFAFYCLGCGKTDNPDSKPCTRSFDTLTLKDTYTEIDSVSPYKGTTTLSFTLRNITLARQSGDCNIVPLCTNLITITNRTEKTISIFYNTVGGVNAIIRPYETKDEVVPTGAIIGVTGACFNFMEFKNSIKVRYY